jgi:adenosylhomocysteine nucleosidase
MATMTEAKPLIGGLSLVETQGAPFRVFRDSRVVLTITGIGKVNAAMACASLIQGFHPGLLCNIGAAGALDDARPLGSLYHINRIIEPDRPDLETGVFVEHVPDVLAGFPMASLATQDRPLRRPEERAGVVGFADLIDMEGAAIVQAARNFGVRCFVFKFVSDTPDHAVRSAIIENIRKHRDGQLLFFREMALPALLAAGRQRSDEGLSDQKKLLMPSEGVALRTFRSGDSRG